MPARKFVLFICLLKANNEKYEENRGIVKLTFLEYNCSCRTIIFQERNKMVTRQYYTAQEAMERLGMKKSLFYHYVGQGQIKKYLPQNKQRGALFSIKEIDEMAAARGISQEKSDEQQSEFRQKTVFREARLEDAGEMYKLRQDVMARREEREFAPFEDPDDYHLGEPIIGFTRLKFSHVLIRDGRLIGYFTVLPLKHETLMELAHNELRERDLRHEVTARFEPGEPIDCLIWEIVSDPDKKQIGAYLVGKMLSFFHTLGKQGIEIQGIFAFALSRKSINHCSRVGMRPMDLPRISGRWIPFKINVPGTKNKFTGNYIQALKSYKKRELHKINYADRRDEADAVEHRVGTVVSEYERYEEALAAFEQVIQINPESADGHFGKGAALHFLGRQEEAQQAYEQALKLTRKSRQEEEAFEQDVPIDTNNAESPGAEKPIRRRRKMFSDPSNLDFEGIDLRVQRHRRSAAVGENIAESAGSEKSRESESNQTNLATSMDRMAKIPDSSAGERANPDTPTNRLPEIPS